MDETFPRVPGTDDAGELTSSAYLQITVAPTTLVAPVALEEGEAIVVGGANPPAPEPDHPEQLAPAAISPAGDLGHLTRKLGPVGARGS